jgi:hypothetical protein
MLCVAATGDAIWPVYVIVVLIGSAKAFLGPVSKALVPNLVPAGDLSRGFAITQSFGGTARLLAPALGGLLYAFGPLVPFAAASVLSALGVASCIGIGRRPPESAASSVSWSTLVAGFVFIWSAPVVMAAMGLDLVAVLLGGATALMPYYAQIFHVGPWALGLMRTPPAVGGLLTSGMLARWPLQRRAGPTLLAVVMIYGIGTIGFADAMRGRVSAVHSLFTGASGKLGEVESGLLSSAIGVVPCVVLGGIAAIVAAVAWAALVRALRRADRFEGSTDCLRLVWIA